MPYDRDVAAFNPSFLIAVPQLGDPNFAHSIILMLEHAPGGALGLVINDPTALNLGGFAENHALMCSDDIAEAPVFKGGPVEPAGGWIIHQNELLDEKQEIIPGLYLSGSQETLKTLLATGYKDMRFLLGYAGWGEGQLDEEITQGAWLTTEVNPTHIFETANDKIWHAVLGDMGIDPSQLMLGGSKLH